MGGIQIKKMSVAAGLNPVVQNNASANKMVNNMQPKTSKAVQTNENDYQELNFAEETKPQAKPDKTSSFNVIYRNPGENSLYSGTPLENSKYGHLADELGIQVPDNYHLTGEYEVEDTASKRSEAGDKFYFDPYNPKCLCYTSDPKSETVMDESGSHQAETRYINTVIVTTDPNITEEEAAHGVVRKERIELENTVYLNDPHIDMFEYEDGSVLRNIYAQNTKLTGQEELSFSEGCDPKHPKNGDKRYTIERHFNSDGTWIEKRRTATYREGMGWCQNMSYNSFDNIAHDAEGNTYYADSKEFKEIYQREFYERHRNIS